MYSISSALYGETAQRLCDAIDGENYFSGSLEYLSGGVECRFVCSVIVYRRPSGCPGECGGAISGLVPVWWEFHTDTDDGEVLNDFSFEVLARCII